MDDPTRSEESLEALMRLGARLSRRGANGQLVCNTCGDPGTGGATGTGGTTGGSTSGPCQMMPRPWTGGTAPCSVSSQAR